MFNRKARRVLRKVPQSLFIQSSVYQKFAYFESWGYFIVEAILCINDFSEWTHMTDIQIDIGVCYG